jgi:hypothetical protein
MFSFTRQDSESFHNTMTEEIALKDLVSRSVKLFSAFPRNLTDVFQQAQSHRGSIEPCKC